MNEREHLLVCIAEECGEVAHEVHKSLRFGLHDYNPNDETQTPNHARIENELADLLTVVEMAIDAGMFRRPFPNPAKREKVMRFIAYARETGAIE